MKTAFSVWNDRIAPVFDVARRVILVDTRATGRDAQTRVLLTGDQPLQKVQELSALGIDHLVCGAISRALQAVLTARGIHVVACVAGDVQAVIDAWQRRHCAIEPFTMPGRRQSRHRKSRPHPVGGASTTRKGGAGDRGPGGRKPCR